MDDEKENRSVLRSIEHEIKSHAAAYLILAAFSLAGLVIGHLVFPDMSIGIGVMAGFAFGVYVALFAFPDKFL